MPLDAYIHAGFSMTKALWRFASRRRLAFPKRTENWSLTSLQQRLAKTGGRLAKRGCGPRWRATRWNRCSSTTSS
jgi:hypothetical protein